MAASPLRAGYTGIGITVSAPGEEPFTVDWQRAADRIVRALPRDPRGEVYDYALAHTLLTKIFNQEDTDV